MAQVCCGCGGKVFPAEKLVLNGKTFHRGGCAKCGICGAALTVKNLVSVSSEDKSQWCCNAHGVATVNKVGGHVPTELHYESASTLREGYSNSNAFETSKTKRRSAARRFAAFLRKAVQDEESKRFGAISSMIRSSIRKQATKEALTALTTEKQSELAAFVEEIRQQEAENASSFVSSNDTNMRAFPSNSTMASTASGASMENSGSRMNRFVRSLRLNKPSAPAKPAPPSGPPPTRSAFGSSPFGKNRFVSVSLKNVHIQDKRNKFQKN